ncbi:MAG: hypothetical protein JW820_06610 [Spirochaetales bacterium]|nr:hypothetical protein [Spirochaetales bacterium]
MFTSVGQGDYVAEKAEGDKGWLFPVGDELGELETIMLRISQHFESGLTADRRYYFDVEYDWDRIDYTVRPRGGERRTTPE